jgi:hypothetical protein
MQICEIYGTNRNLYETLVANALRAESLVNINPAYKYNIKMNLIEDNTYFIQ